AAYGQGCPSARRSRCLHRRARPQHPQRWRPPAIASPRSASFAKFLAVHAPPFLGNQSEPQLVQPRAVEHRSILEPQRAFVDPALSLVVEDRGEVSRERGTTDLRDLQAIETIIEQGGAGFIDDVLAPPALITDHHIE